MQDRLYFYQAYLLRVIDGDTLLVFLDLGFGVWRKIRLRLARINCPETRGKHKQAGLSAKYYVESILPDLFLIKSRRVDSFGRAIAEVWFKHNHCWVNLSSLLLYKGHATKFKK